MILRKNKNVGHVLFIVEGAKHEFTIIKRIFLNILGYQLIEKRRNKAEYYVSKINNNNIIAVINTENTCIKSIQDENGYLDQIYEYLLETYEFNLKNAAIYYLFDRDVRSNTDTQLIRSLLTILKNSRENEDNMLGGVLLLSYPAIEAYDVSNFVDDTYKLEYQLGKELKRYINENANKISLNKINEKTVIKASQEMMKYYMAHCIDLDLDDMGESNIKIYDTQEDYYKNSKKYKVMSLISLALLDLGILVDEEFQHEWYSEKM